MRLMSNNIEQLRYIAEGLLPPLVDITQKVLVIDDEYRSLTAFKSRFRRDAKVYTASNLDEALLHLNDQNIDIVFCDYRMPVNGADVLRVIYKEYPKVKRVVITGFDNISIRKECKDKSNTTKFICKPYSRAEVFNSIYSIT